MNRTVAIGLLLLILAVASLLVGSGLLRQLARRPLDETKLEALGRAAVARARKDVEQFGWHFVLIPGEGGDSGFLFTIGLWQTYKHPEIIAFSPTEDPQRILGRFTSVAKRIAAGERFEVGKTYEGLFGDYPGAFREVHADRYADYLGTAGGFYDNFDFPAQQLFWPDREGRFPWEGGFDERMRDLQPLLYEARPAEISGFGAAPFYRGQRAGPRHDRGEPPGRAAPPPG